MDLLDGVKAETIDTDRMATHVYQYGPEDGVPVLMIHGNLSTGRFYEHIWPKSPGGYRFIAPDMRGFGRSEHKTLDGSRGLGDWADDAYAVIEALGITDPVHIAGWSTGGAAIATYAMDHPVASLTFIDPVSPYGFGGVHRDGTPCFPDYSGSGGGTGNPEFVERLQRGDRSAEDPTSPRNVLRTSYWSPEHLEPREDILLEEVLLSLTGDAGYPGDMTVSENWPGVAPGTTGILNALSPKYCNWSDIVGLDPKPPVLWTHGTADIVVADGSAWEMGTLGQMELVPGWPGAEVYPPQLMVTQIRDVLQAYADAGGTVRMEMFEGSGHGPFIDAADRWSEVFFEHLASAT